MGIEEYDLRERGFWRTRKSGRRLRPAAQHVRALLSIGLALWMATTVRAADPARPSLADLSLEELLNESVTSVSKKETKLSQSPAAISVITQEDIRHSGMTSIPELLRQVPGLDVARINGNQWAISSRGFNNQYANKLLVLIDGRAVYTPSFGGVYWNAQDVVLEDVDRIEVIRGPGATLWGANAVNGVINITTKSAKETQGGMVTTTFGTEDQPSTTVRYGGRLATNLHYRAYVKYFNRDGLVESTGGSAPDDWRALRGGMRFDWEPSTENKFTLQGDYYGNAVGANLREPNLTPPDFYRSQDITRDNRGGNVLGRWTHLLSDTAQLSVQSYYDHVQQSDGFTQMTQDTYDLDVQHRFALGARQDIVWGIGYRHTEIDVTPSFFVTATPDHHELPLYNVFLQDEITLLPARLRLTLGTKFEHNHYTGWEIQPSGRLLWTPNDRQTVWTSVSRAVRTPTILDTHGRVNVTAFQPSPADPAVLVSVLGNPHFASETLISYELGHRLEVTKEFSFDVAGFYNVYDDLMAYEPGTPRFETDPAPAHLLVPRTARNSQSGITYGTELSARWQVTEHWRLVGSYSWLHMRLDPNESTEGDSPQHQFQIRSYLDLPYHLGLNGALYFVDQINSDSGQTRRTVPSYVRLDLGVTWRPRPSLELGIWGQNLLDDRHGEFNSIRTPVRTEVPRGVLGKITWRF